jgi:hypothetical protein
MRKEEKMGNRYVVSLRLKEDGLINKTICETDKDLAVLLQHVDKDIYDIVGIDIDNKRYFNYKEFCRKNKGIEIGK